MALENFKVQQMRDTTAGETAIPRTCTRFICHSNPTPLVVVHIQGCMYLYCDTSKVKHNSTAARKHKVIQLVYLSNALTCTASANATDKQVQAQTNAPTSTSPNDFCDIQ